jgi:hypothetical protein
MPKARILPSILMIAALIAGQAAWADCGTDYDQAVGMLESVKKRAPGYENPGPDEFSKDFQGVVDKLQAGQCLPELKNLLNYIQAEQQKFPDAKPDKPPAPIVD